MNKKISILLCLTLVGVFTSCDVIEAPYTKKVVTDTTTTGAVKRKVLLEEFTGHICTNCPDAHRLIKQLETTYGDKLIAVGIHAGGLAEPSAEHPADFRTDEGNTLFDQFKVTGIPIGMVNRTKYDGKSSFVLGRASWGQFIASESAKEPEIKIELTTTANESTKSITGTSKFTYLKDQTTKLYVTYYVVEDSITSYQLDAGVDIPDYNHMHVLRASFAGAFGEELTSEATVAKNTAITKNISYTIPSGKNWNFENLKLVCFVHTNKPNYSVLQAEEVHFVK